MTLCSEKEYRDKLLRIVKKEVKQIMEEAVTRKFVHEESSSITSLCAAIDACLSHGLKRRALGLFKTNSTTALLQKVAKNFEPAAKVYHRVVEIENSDPNKRTSSSSDSTGQLKNRLISSPTHTARYLWIRIALFEKVLVSIVDHVVQNSSQYFEKEALVADRVSGEILAALLVGPCALDYSKMKTQDHYWTDPPADELVQRNRLVNPISGATPPTPPITRRPLGLPSRRVAIADSRVVSGSDDQARLAGWSARDYVESLHQNCKSTLLYGKNNVLVQPRENLEPIPGYLSLHQTPAGLVIKWTPNQLMHGSISMNGDQNSSTENSVQDKSQFWEYAMTVNVEDIVYLHCHQQDSGGTAVLVGQDGVQQPPIRFPKGGALLAFLSCLENGLTPYGQLDPPLWTQKGKGKVFPKLKRKNPRASKENCPTKTEDVSNDNESMDYVFRIVSSIDKPESISQEMFDPKTTRTGSYLWKIRNGLKQHHSSSSSCSSTSSKSMSEDGNSISGINSQDTSTGNSTNTSKNVRDIKYQQQQQQNIPTEQSIKTLCDSMRKQIISRAFYGWLAHCRHLRTVRTHLAGLINPTIVSIDKPCDASGGLTKEKWEAFFNEQGQITDHDEIRRLIYFGGCAHEIRKQVWLYLLGHFDFMSTEQERQQRTEELAQHYELTMTEWLAVEAIVKQRDKEIIAANLAKLSSESNNSSEMPLTGPKGNQSESNEVFSDVSDSEDANSENPVNGKRKVKHLDSQDESKSLNGQDGQSERVNKLQEQDSEESIAKTESRKSSTNSCLRRQRQISENQNVVITNPSVDLTRNSSKVEMNGDHDQVDQAEDEGSRKGSNDGGLCLEPNGTCISPASSNGGVYSNELLDLFSLNLHRIDKDVQRCDRNYWYFMKKENLEKLRNVMCTYVWEHLDQGYIQGMCDLIAPLLVIFDDEILSYSCFCELMKRMVVNFPHGGAMDTHFANMRSLIQILDNEIFDLMHQNGDYTHFYFCYRWFLLDFKREFMYEDIFHVWEVIWAAKHIASPHFVLFMALALVEYYRDIILENDMDFTDIIKFFNEMAERHDAKALLKISRNLVLQIQTLIENNTN